jgi:hypothetical protein
VASLGDHLRELLQSEQWNIGVVEQPLHEVALRGISKPVRWLTRPKRNEFFADPFGDADTGAVYCEQFSYRTNKGVIARIDRDGAVTVVLERETHASYPSILRHEGRAYIVPEIAKAGRVVMIDVTTGEERVLLDGVPALDPTLVQHEGRWWLFCGRLPGNARLDIYHAATLDGPFVAHASNPVKMDLASARPAGALFEHEGRLYRPSQDCSRTYGGAVVINEVLELSTAAYRERPVARLEPDAAWPYNAGLHTLSAFGENATLIDAKRFHFNFDHFATVLRRKLSKTFRR